MKASQKLRVRVENIAFITRFDQLDTKLLPLVCRLEREGDIYGPVCTVVDYMAVAIEYADKRRPPVKPTIFGYDADELLAKQY